MVSSNRQKFHAFTLKYKLWANRIITEVNLSQAYDPAHIPVPHPPIHNTHALWDTGATRSVITTTTAATLQLTTVGNTVMNHAGGSDTVNTYVINVFLPNNVGIPGVLVSECKDIPGGFGAIIGMDIIGMGDFAITNVNKETWMSFRLPSIQRIDYVEEFEKVRYIGTPQSRPCPCGKINSSGRAVKFKDCHGTRANFRLSS